MESLDGSGGSLQRRTLAAYLVLAESADDWARRLVMLSASADAAAFAIATLAAGGAVLWTSPNDLALRESGLAGVTDFQVNTLSEALRILKTEIRKGQPVSVGVLDVGQNVWAEAFSRGVQPHAVLPGQFDGAVAALLVDRGAQNLAPRSDYVMEEQHSTGWRERRVQDAVLLAGLADIPERERGIAERWLKSAPLLFPRDMARWYAAAWRASKNDR